MGKIRFGIIGTNFITDRFMEGIKLVEGACAEALYSRTKERGMAFANQYGITHVFTNLEEMAKSEVIDAVYIASPNALHAEQAILFLNHKKHVLCEKAFASHTKEVDAMIEAAKQNDVVLMEAIKTRYVPNYKVVEENLHRIGRVRKYFASFCQYSSRYDAFKQGEVLNAFKPELSNGALVDIGVYCIAPMVQLFGSPQTVQAMGVILDSGVDGEGSALFGYENMTATIMYSKISSSHLSSEIQGEDGSIVIEKINDFSKVKLILRTGEEIDLSVIQESADLCYEIDAFVSLIQVSDRSQMDKWLVQSRETVRLMETMRKQMGIVYLADSEV